MGSPTFVARDVVMVSGQPLCQLVSGKTRTVVEALQDSARGEYGQGSVERREGDREAEELVDLFGSTGTVRLGELLNDQSPSFGGAYTRVEQAFLCEISGWSALRVHCTDGTV